MDPQRLQQIEDLYHAALQRAPQERFAWVERACGDDAELRHEVESLLSQHDGSDGILRKPLHDAAADLTASSTSYVLTSGNMITSHIRRREN